MFINSGLGDSTSSSAATNSVLESVGISPSSNIEQEVSQYVIEGFSFSLGGILLSLAILYFGGRELRTKLKSVI